VADARSATTSVGRQGPHALLLHAPSSRQTPPSFLLPPTLSPPPPSLFPPLPHHATPPCALVLPFVRTDCGSTGGPSSSATSRGAPPRHRSKPGWLKSPPSSPFLASSASGHPSSPSVPFEPQIDRLALSLSRGDLLDIRRPRWPPSSVGAASLPVSPPPSPSPRLPSASPRPPPRVASAPCHTGGPSQAVGHHSYSHTGDERATVCPGRVVTTPVSPLSAWAASTPWANFWSWAEPR
jgi:hypothetical protein